MKGHLRLPGFGGHEARHLIFAERRQAESPTFAERLVSAAFLFLVKRGSLLGHLFFQGWFFLVVFRKAGNIPGITLLGPGVAYWNQKEVRRIDDDI